MKCPVCGVEMLLYGRKTGESGTEVSTYVCRNKRCPRFDERLRRKSAEERAEAKNE